MLTEGPDEAALSRGIFDAYQTLNLRYSQLAPLTMWEERNTGTNLPAQIELYADTEPGHELAYKFLVMAKGGGSANKSFLFQETKALLNPASMTRFLDEKLRSLGTAACPPYHLAIVIGGTSAEYALKTAKYASAKYLDGLPTTGSAAGHAFRDLGMEAEVLTLTQQFGIGAQFGGKYFCHDVRVVRLPRHGASCPVAIAVSCSADRQALAKITPEGVFLEQLERDPAHYLPEITDEHLDDTVRPHRPEPADGRDPRAADGTAGQDPGLADRHPGRGPGHRPCEGQGDARPGRGDAPVPARPSGLLRGAGQDPRGVRVRLVRADHGRAHGRLRRPVPEGRRLDGHAGQGQSLGRRDQRLPGQRRVLPRLDRRSGRPPGQGQHPSVEVLDFPELGMEAVWRIEVEDFPAFVVVDDKGNDFFAETSKPTITSIPVGPPRG